jgi:hypothetical protein
MLQCSNMHATGQYPHAAGFGPYLRTQFLQCFFFPVALRPDYGSWPLLTEIRDHFHWTRDTLQDSSARVISPSQRVLTTHNTHNRQNIHAPAEFEPKIAASAKLQTNGLDRAATGIGIS